MNNDSYLSYLNLYAAYSKKHVSNLIRNKCIEEEVNNSGEILQSWQDATESLRQIEKQENGIADNCEISEINSGLIEAIRLNPSIKNTFSNDVLDFGMVEIDNVFAPQRDVLLDYVEQLSKKMGEK